jgi:hypothetical protein
MADSTLSITVRDRLHPCAAVPGTTVHSFKAQIFHCDGTPLFWKGVNDGSGRGSPTLESKAAYDIQAFFGGCLVSRSQTTQSMHRSGRGDDPWTQLIPGSESC